MHLVVKPVIQAFRLDRKNQYEQESHPSSSASVMTRQSTNASDLSQMLLCDTVLTFPDQNNHCNSKCNETNTFSDVIMNLIDSSDLPWGAIQRNSLASSVQIFKLISIGKLNIKVIDRYREVIQTLVEGDTLDSTLQTALEEALQALPSQCTDSGCKGGARNPLGWPGSANTSPTESPIVTDKVLRKRKGKEADSTSSKRRAFQSPPPAPVTRVGRARRGRGASVWDNARITPDSLLITGARAHKVLGLREDRVSLFTKHVDLFKYMCDEEDKNWLRKENLIAPNNSKGVFICVMQDIHQLALSREYKKNANVKLHELSGFRAPDFMVQKIRTFMLSGDDISTPMAMKVAPAQDQVMSMISSGSMLTTLPPSLEALAVRSSKSNTVSTSSMTSLSLSSCPSLAQPQQEVDELSLNPSLDELEKYINSVDPTTRLLRQDEAASNNSILLSLVNTQEDELSSIVGSAAESECVDKTLDAGALSFGVNLDPEVMTSISWTLVGDDGQLIAPVPSTGSNATAMPDHESCYPTLSCNLELSRSQS